MKGERQNIILPKENNTHEWAMKLKAEAGREKAVQRKDKKIKRRQKKSRADKEDKDVRTGDCRRRDCILLN